MSDTLLLAWYYLRHHKGKTLTLTLCLMVALSLPMTVHGLVDALHTQMLQRAHQTPLVVGPAGSQFDLVLHALYFRNSAPGVIRQSERFAIDRRTDVTAIPLFIRYQAAGHPIVGTTLEYFAFRNLEFARGQPMVRLGDCVVGADVARRLGISPGDRLRSDPDNVFDLGGSYPLDMRVTGVLERSRSPDDRAVFVDVNTAWVIEGIGHGHDDLDESADNDVILERRDDGLVASPALEMYTRITPGNIDSFHVHGDPADFPLTAIIAVPDDDRASTILRGRYVAEDARYQALRPVEVVDQLMSMIVELRRFFDMHHLFMLAVTGVLVALVMALSLRLRRQEVQTMFHLGCSRGRIVALQASELLILLAISTALATGISWVIVQATGMWIQTLTV